MLVLLISVAASGCQRYADKPDCGTYFQAGDLAGWSVDSQGLATDPRTGLRWFRCNAGERFVAQSCIGEPHHFDLAAAKAYAQDFSAASGRAWRLPKVTEMRRLQQSKCRNPAINTQVFPSALADKYWSSDTSPYGGWLGCSFYAFNGNSHCRDLATTTALFWLVLDESH